MPLDPAGFLVPWTQPEIDAMEPETVGVRDGGNPTETREIGQSTMRRPWLCNWEDRFNFASVLTGDEVMWDDSGTKKLSRMLPHAEYGRHPDFPELVCTKIERMRGHQIVDEGADHMPTYSKCWIDALYEHVPYKLREDDEITFEHERYTWFGGAKNGSDAVTMPGATQRFWRDPALPGAPGRPDNIPIPYSYNVVRPTETFYMHWERIPFECFDSNSPLDQRVYGSATVTSYIGMINSLTTTFRRRPAGTVMFMGVEAKLERSHTGVGQRWSLTYEFLYTPVMHTHLRFADPTGAANGWYFSGSTGTFRTPAALNDFESIVQGSRDLDRLWLVST